jgi:hypothetical protein
VVVHFVDGHHQLGHAQRLGQLRVLTRLTATLKAGLKLALAQGTAGCSAGWASHSGAGQS